LQFTWRHIEVVEKGVTYLADAVYSLEHRAMWDVRSVVVQVS